MIVAYTITAPVTSESNERRFGKSQRSFAKSRTIVISLFLQKRRKLLFDNDLTIFSSSGTAIATWAVAATTQTNDGVDMRGTEQCQTVNVSDDIAETGPRHSGTPAAGQSDFVGGLESPAYPQ